MIRKATRDDSETIARFNVNLAKETEQLDLTLGQVKKGVQAIIEDPSKGQYFVYEKNNQVIGQIMVTYEWSDWRNSNFWWIQSVYVHQDERKQGVFQSLYAHVTKLVQNDPMIGGLRLYVERDNTTAQSTYKKLGMEETHYLLYEWEK